MSATLPPVLCIYGPTASGKTNLAVRLARRYGGEIVVADSRQVYRGLDIGSGKDRVAYGRGRAAVPVHLLDSLSPRGQMTASRYQRLALKVLRDVTARGQLPILVVGTPLYGDAVTRGYQFPKNTLSVRASRQLRQRLQRQPLAALFRQLKRVDPTTWAVVDRANRRRVERALEVYCASGQPKSALMHQQPPPYRFVHLGLQVPRATLYRRIDARLQTRWRAGLVAEVRRLHDRERVSWARLERFGLEYAWVARYLQGQISRAECLVGLSGAIHDFARRQLTWWRRDERITWVQTPTAAERYVRRALGS